MLQKNFCWQKCY